MRRVVLLFYEGVRFLFNISLVLNLPSFGEEEDPPPPIIPPTRGEEEVDEEESKDVASPSSSSSNEKSASWFKRLERGREAFSSPRS